MQRGLQRRQSAPHRVGRGGHYTRIAQVAVDQCLGVVQFDGHSGGGQEFRVAGTVVTQGVVARNRDVGRWQSGQVRGPRTLPVVFR